MQTGDKVRVPGWTVECTNDWMGTITNTSKLMAYVKLDSHHKDKDDVGGLWVYKKHLTVIGYQTELQQLFDDVPSGLRASGAGFKRAKDWVER